MKDIILCGECRTPGACSAVNKCALLSQAAARVPQASKDVSSIVSRMRSMLDREPPNYCCSILLSAEDASALLAEIERLRGEILKLESHIVDVYNAQEAAQVETSSPHCPGCVPVMSVKHERDCPVVRHCRCGFSDADGTVVPGESCAIHDPPQEKTSCKPLASTDGGASPSRPSPSSVECPKCRTQLAFEGDECGLCKEEA